MKLGENIYTLRKEKGFSQEKLAEKVNVTRQTISNWELGSTYPNPEQLMSLSQTLNTSIDVLVGNEVQQQAVYQVSSLKKVYVSLAIICGALAGVLSFAANRFRFVEIALIVIIGVVVGVCIAALIHGVLKYVKSKNA